MWDIKLFEHLLERSVCMSDEVSTHNDLHDLHDLENEIHICKESGALPNHEGGTIDAFR